jgi:hypothetical protein
LICSAWFQGLDFVAQLLVLAVVIGVSLKLNDRYNDDERR